MCWVGRVNPLPAAGVGPLPSGVGFAAISGGRSHTLDSLSQQRSGHRVTALAGRDDGYRRYYRHRHSWNSANSAPAGSMTARQDAERTPRPQAGIQDAESRHPQRHGATTLELSSNACEVRRYDAESAARTAVLDRWLRASSRLRSQLVRLALATRPQARASSRSASSAHREESRLRASNRSTTSTVTPVPVESE